MSQRAIREAEPAAAGREMSAFEAAEGALLESGVSASRAVRAALTRTLVCYGLRAFPLSPFALRGLRALLRSRSVFAHAG